QVVRSSRTVLQDGRELETLRQINYPTHRHVMPLVVEVRAPFVGCKRISSEPRIVTVSTTATVIRVRPRQRVVGIELETMAHALTEGKVGTVVVRTVNRLVVAHATQQCLPGRCKRSIERTLTARPVHWNLLVYVNGLVIMEAEHMGVLHLDRRIRIQR